MKKYIFLLAFSGFIFTSWYIQHETKLNVSFEDDLLFLNVDNPTGENLRFLINSDEYTYINKTGKKKLRFKSKNENVWLDSGLKDLFLDQSIPAPSTENMEFIKEKDTVIDGELGIVWLREKIWSIDYLRKEFYYQEIRKASRDKRVGTLNIDSEHPIVTVQIDTLELPMYLNLGSNIKLDPHTKAVLSKKSNYIGISYLDSQVFMDLQSGNKSWKTVRNKQGTIQLLEVPKVRMGSISIGPTWFAKSPEPYLQSSCIKDAYGSLGGNFWSQFGSITFDFTNNGIYHNRNE